MSFKFISSQKNRLTQKLIDSVYEDKVFKEFHPKLWYCRLVLSILTGIAVLVAIAPLYGWVNEFIPDQYEIWRNVRTAIAVFVFMLFAGCDLYCRYAYLFKNKSIEFDEHSLDVIHQTFRMDFGYIDKILPQLSSICGPVLVRAQYWSRKRGFYYETLPVKAGYRDLWENRKGHRIARIVFESAKDQESPHFTLTFKRTPGNVSARITLEGYKLKFVAREEILQIIEKENFALRLQYNVLANRHFGAVFFLYLLLGQLIVYFLLAEPEQPFFSWLIYSHYHVLVYLITNIVALIFAGILLFMRCLYFPAGIFMMDQEAAETERLEETQRQIVSFMPKLFLLLIFGKEI